MEFFIAFTSLQSTPCKIFSTSRLLSSVYKCIKDISTTLRTYAYSQYNVKNETFRYIPKNDKDPRYVQQVNVYHTNCIFLVPEYFKTQEMCIGAAVADPWQLHNVPNNFKTQVMCDDVVCEHPCNLQYNPDSLK